MNLTHMAIFCYWAGFCQAGPVAQTAAKAAGAIGGSGAKAAVASTKIANAFGVSTSGIWFDGYILIDRTLVSPEKTCIGLIAVLTCI